MNHNKGKGEKKVPTHLNLNGQCLVMHSSSYINTFIICVFHIYTRNNGKKKELEMQIGLYVGNIVVCMAQTNKIYYFLQSG